MCLKLFKSKPDIQSVTKHSSDIKRSYASISIAIKLPDLFADSAISLCNYT